MAETDNTNENFRTLPVWKLLKKRYKFVIPSYQRGYRWEPKQVEDLINDLQQFVEDERSTNNDNDSYYLQPLVVKFLPEIQLKDGTIISDAWEVLDGQQRLTTLRLLLLHLLNNTKLLEDDEAENLKNNLYEIFYLTRLSLNWKTPDKSENIDSYYLANAKSTIEKHFNTIPSYTRRLIKEALIDRPKKQVKFIWYEVPEQSKDLESIEVFNRLNKGKISLTNAELIKALFVLDCEKSGASSEQLAIEWDYMERQFQNEDFWAFISGNAEYADRIDLLFDLLTGKTDDVDKDFSYRKFQNLFDYCHRIANEESKDDDEEDNMEIQVGLDSLWKNKKVKGLHEAWLEIKREFDKLQAWFNDQTYYHYIGFLTQAGKKVSEINAGMETMKLDNLKENKAWTRIDAINLLRDMIAHHFNPKEKFSDDGIRSLDYNDNLGKIRELLLLFNIETYRKTGAQRFPFSLYKSEKWDVEHIDSQNDNGCLKSAADQLRWMRLVAEILLKELDAGGNVKQKAKELSDQLNAEVKAKTTDNQGNKIEDKDAKNVESSFKRLYTAVMDYYAATTTGKVEIGAKHSIGNLTLLNSFINRGYQDAPYPYKRQYIMNEDLKGSFIPSCTRNVFLKYYSDSNKSAGFTDTMRWNNSDKESYQNKIIEAVRPIFDCFTNAPKWKTRN